MAARIRPARSGDAARIAAIYNEGIQDRQATFETDLRSSADFPDLDDSGAPPFLVAELDGQVVGWARLSPYSDRACYAGVAEASAYIARTSRGQEIGRQLLDALATEAERRGYWKVIGLLFPENRASVTLCRRTGFREVGLLLRHGRLDGDWRDVLLMERPLGEAARD